MPDPILDNAPPGQREYQIMLDQGVSQADADAYRAHTSKTMMDQGVNPNDVLKYWGLDQPTPDMKGMESAVKDNLSRLAPEDHTRIAGNTFEQFAAGLGQSATSLLFHAPEVAPMKDPSLFQKIVAAAGQEVGDAPFQIIGGSLGQSLGAGAGAAAGGAVGGPGGAATGATIGSGMGMGAGAAALPAAMRSTLMDIYSSKGGPFTWKDVWAHTAHVIGDTAKAAAAGAAGGAVVGPIGGAVEKATAPLLSPAAASVAGKTAGLIGFSEAATAAGSALDGRVPDRDEQIVGATLAIGFGAAAAFTGATQRPVIKPAGAMVAKNLSDIYVDTGLRPIDVGKAAAQDVSVREEVLAPTDADGKRVTPVLDQMRLAEPEPYKQIEAPAEGTPPPPPPPKTGRELLAPPTLPAEEIENRQLVHQGDDGSWEPINSHEIRLQEVPSTTGNTHKYSLLDDRGENIGEASVTYDPEEKIIRVDNVVTDKGEPGKPQNTLGGQTIIRLRRQLQKEFPDAVRITGNRVSGANPGREISIDLSGGGGKPPEPPKPALSGPEEGPDHINLLASNDYRKSVIDEILAPAPETGGIVYRGFQGVRQFIAAFQSQLEPANQLDRELDLLGPHTQEGSIKAPGNLGIADMMRMTYGSAARVNYMIRHGGITPGHGTFDETGRPAVLDAFQRVKTDGGNTQDFYRYLLAQRTVEKAAQGIDTGIPLDVAVAHVSDRANIRMYETAAHVLTRAKDGFIDYGTASGLWSISRANDMKNLNQYHIVFRRVMDPSYTGGPSYRPTTSPVKKMEGSDLKIMDPGKADIDNMHTIIALADRNRAIGNIIGLIRLKTGSQVGNVPGIGHNGGPITDIEVKDITDTIHMEQVPLEAFGIDVGKVMHGELLDENDKPIMGPAKEAAAPFLAYRALSSRIGRNDFIYLDNGVPQVWRAADDRIAELVRAQSSMKNPNVLVSMVRWAGRAAATTARYGITADPTFLLRSVSHASFAASVAGENPRFPLVDFFEGLPQAFRDMTGADLAPWYKEFLRNGGGTALSDLDKLQTQDGLHMISAEPKGIMGQLWNVVKGPIAGLQAVQHLLHTSMQAGSYKNSLRNGNLPMKAANQAATSYMDFREPFANPIVQELARWTPFMNVTFKSVEQIGAAFKNHFKQTAAMGFMFLTVPAIVLSVMNHMADRDLPEAEKFANIPEYIRQTHFILPQDASGRRVMWRKPYALDLIFTAWPEKFIDWMAGEHPESLKPLAHTMMQEFLSPPIPTVLQGPGEQVTNTNFVSGNPLIPDSLMQLSNYKRYGATTTKAGQAAGRLLGEPGLGLTTNTVSPIVLDNYFKTLGGTLPYELMHAIDGHFVPSGEHNQGFLHDVVTKSFYLTHADYTPQPIEDLYDKITQFKTAHADLFHTAKAGEDLTSVPDQQRLMAAVRVTGFERGLAGANKMIRGINAMPDDQMTMSEKQKATDAILRPLTDMAKQAVSQFDAIERQARMTAVSARAAAIEAPAQ